MIFDELMEFLSIARDLAVESSVNLADCQSCVTLYVFGLLFHKKDCKYVYLVVNITSFKNFIFFQKRIIHMTREE